MRKLMILPATVLLASAGGAFAEDNAELLQPVSFGAITGNAEKDTVAYDPAAPSDLQVRFKNDCGLRGPSPEQASLEQLESTANRKPTWRICSSRQRTAHQRPGSGPLPGGRYRPAWPGTLSGPLSTATAPPA